MDRVIKHQTINLIQTFALLSKQGATGREYRPIVDLNEGIKLIGLSYKTDRSEIQRLP